VGRSLPRRSKRMRDGIGSECSLRAFHSGTDPAERGKSWKLRYTAGESGKATDLEAALREAVASLPTGMVPRLVLVSDGRRTRVA